MLQFFSSNTLLSAASGLLCVRTESAWDVEVPMYFGFDSHGVPISPTGSGMWTGRYGGPYTNMGAPSVSAAFINPGYSALLPERAYAIVDGTGVVLRESAFAQMRFVTQPVTRSIVRSSWTSDNNPSWDGAYDSITFADRVGRYFFSFTANSRANVAISSVTATPSAQAGNSTAFATMIYSNMTNAADFNNGSATYTAKWTPDRSDGVVALFSGQLR